MTTHATGPVGNADQLETQATWRISTYSGQNGGSCVEAAELPDGRVALRHSHHPAGGGIIYTRTEWNAFLAGVKDGQFDF